MKSLKLSKVSWLILSTGVFLLILLGLGVTHSQQSEEQTRLTDELTTIEMRLNNVKVSQLQQQHEELQAQVQDSENQLNTVKNRLQQLIDSVDVTDKFFVIADNCDVEIITISTTAISEDMLLDTIDCISISVTASVTGTVDNLINFILSLNSGFATGYVMSSQISIPEESSDNTSTAGINMIIYSYEGN